MPNSVREQIIQDLATAVGNVTTGNGYNNTLVSVQRFLQGGVSVASVPTAVINFSEETKTVGPTDRVTNNLYVTIDIWAIHDESQVSGSTATLVDSLASDVEKAVMQDPTRSGLVRNCYVESVRPFSLEESGSFSGATLALRLEFMTDLRDPFTARN